MGPCPPVTEIGCTLLSPPETARMLAVMDQLTCHTTSLNLCSSLGDHMLLEASSQVQMNTRPSWENTGESADGGRNYALISSQSGATLDLCRNWLVDSVQSMVSTILIANFQPSTHAFIPLPQEYTSHRSRVLKVPFLILVYLCIANSQIFSGVFPHACQIMFVSAPSGSIYTFSTEFVWLKTKLRE